MHKTRCLTLEEAFQRIFDDDSDHEQNETDVVILPETIEACDKEEENDNILNNDRDILQNDTAGEIEVHTKKKFEPPKNSAFYVKKTKQKTEHLKWIKKDIMNMSQTNNEKKDRTGNIKNKTRGKTSIELFELLFDSDVFSLLINR